VFSETKSVPPADCSASDFTLQNSGFRRRAADDSRRQDEAKGGAPEGSRLDIPPRRFEAATYVFAKRKEESGENRAVRLPMRRDSPRAANTTR
jgi:hypothetical protein